MINVRIRLWRKPAPLSRILAEVRDHVFVDLLLKVNTDFAVNPNDLVGADAGIRGNVSARIRYAHVVCDVAHMNVRAFDSGGH